MHLQRPAEERRLLAHCWSRVLQVLRALPAREHEYHPPQHASLLHEERDELTPGGSPATFLGCLCRARVAGRLRREGGWRPLLDSEVFRMVFWELYAASCHDAYGPQSRVDRVCRSIGKSSQPQIGFCLVYIDWGALSHVLTCLYLQEYRLHKSTWCSSSVCSNCTPS